MYAAITNIFLLTSSRATDSVRTSKCSGLGKGKLVASALSFLSIIATPPWVAPLTLGGLLRQCMDKPWPSSSRSESDSSRDPWASQVSVTMAIVRASVKKQSTKDLILGRRERAFVFITLNSSLLSKNWGSIRLSSSASCRH